MEIGKGFGLVVFTALLLLMLSVSIVITQPYISDTDPSTYIIVPMLMLPILALFMFKDSRNLVPKVDFRSVLLGIILFAAFLLLVLNARGYLGPLFFAYRIDMLLMPIAIMALASLIFGASKLYRFAWIAIYSLFASPLLLLPIINLNLGFASLNSIVIYYISSLFLHGISFVSPITLYFNGQAITIGNTCIGLGALIGIVMFLLPIAYFLDGSARDKASWILSGLALMIVLNFLRMLFITLGWFFYGPSVNLIDIHSVAGQIIFYAVVVVMILAAGRYSLQYPRLELGTRHRYNGAGICLAVAFSMIYFLVSISYLNAASASVSSLSYNATLSVGSADSLYNSYISYQSSISTVFGAGNRSVAMFLPRPNVSAQNTVVIFGQPNASAFQSITAVNSSVGWKEYLHGSNVSYLYQEGAASPLFVYHTVVPYQRGSSTYMLDMYVVETGLGTNRPPMCQNAYELFYDTIANLAALNPNLFSGSEDAGYCTISGVLK